MPKLLRALSVAGVAALLAGCAGRTFPAAGNGALPPAANPDMGGSLHVLYSFADGNDGGDPASALTFDARGNLYGTSVTGGTYGCGTVFELVAQSSSWRESVLHDFTCYADGKNPYGGVTLDRHGDLDGTTVAGGAGGGCSDGCGVVFQLTQSGEKVLHDFSGGSDGFGPGGGVVLDARGNLYGTTPDGGEYSNGVVYRVAARHESEAVIHAFTGGSDGGTGSLGALLFDAAGNLFGVTETGGAHSAGTVFELAKRSKSRWSLRTLYAFAGMPDCASPYGGLIADGSGNLYGTTYYGGANGQGCVFELARRGRGSYSEHVLYSFKGGDDGASSTSTPIFGRAGELYGTTSAGGGSCNCGTIFKLNAKTGKEVVLHAFTGSPDGAFPYYGLTKDAAGDFYGTTVQGGTSNQGTVFEYAPAASPPDAQPATRYPGLKDLYVADYGAGIMLLKNDGYSRDGVITDGVSGPYGATLDRSGDLYVANRTGGNVTEYAPGASEPSFAYSAGMINPLSVNVDRKGDLFETDRPIYRGGDTVNEYRQHSNAPLHSCTVPGIWGVAIDPAGNVFVDYYVSGHGGSLAEFKGGLAGCSATTLGAQVDSAGGIALDDKDDILVADFDREKVDVIAPPYGAVTRRIGHDLGSPQSVSIDRSNKRLFVSTSYTLRSVVYVLDYATGQKIRRLATREEIGDPTAAVDGPNAVP